MAGYVMKMSILVSNINQCGQKDFSFKVRHKAYARPLGASPGQKTHYTNISN